MMRPVHILSFACYLMLFIACAQQDETAQFKEVAVEESSEDTSTLNLKENRNGPDEILASKHYWKLGKQKVEDLIDLINMSTDSNLDESMASSIESEISNLLFSLDSSEEILANLKGIGKIKSVDNKTELEECVPGLRCFSMVFKLKGVEGDIIKVMVEFILTEETQRFGTESEVIRKVRIDKVLLNMLSV